MQSLRSGSGESTMETFASKVRFGGGPRFDPLLEEKGGWIAGEGNRHDEIMADAMIEVMAEERSQISDKDPKIPFRGQSGEVLTAHLERSFSGFLVRRDAIKFQVNSEKLLACITMLKDQLLITLYSLIGDFGKSQNKIRP